MLAASISTFTEELAGVCSSKLTVPLKVWNWPRTFEIIMWRALNCTCEWELSMAQVVVISSSCTIILEASLAAPCEQEREQEREHFF
jgi:hypothetical protein